MAGSSDPPGSSGRALGARLQTIFSLPFPLTVITLCGVSYVLIYTLHVPEFEFQFWARLPMRALDYAEANTWAAILLSLFVLAALPLAWLAFRQREVRASRAIREWVIAAIVFGVIFWLRTAWPYDDNRWRVLVYGILLFSAWNGVIEAILSTLKIIAFHWANRAKSVQPPTGIS
jgi:hypothetical protein